MFLQRGLRNGSNVWKRGSRSIHSVARLANGPNFEKNGIQGLYSPAGFAKAWSDYQNYLTINLSLATNGTENELRTPYQILLNTAKQTTEQNTYHYASQAHNNHFVFEQLADKEFASTTKPSRYLIERLTEQDFNSLDDFREEFLLSADLMMGQGWVFLVERADKSLLILRCGNDGTPYHFSKNQSLDFNGAIDQASFNYFNLLKERAESGAKDFTLPILGINCWDFAYLEDYGVAGKADYLANFWDCINWNVVNKRIFQV